MSLEITQTSRDDSTPTRSFGKGDNLFLLTGNTRHISMEADTLVPHVCRGLVEAVKVAGQDALSHGRRSSPRTLSSGGQCVCPASLAPRSSRGTRTAGHDRRVGRHAITVARRCGLSWRHGWLQEEKKMHYEWRWSGQGGRGCLRLTPLHRGRDDAVAPLLGSVAGWRQVRAAQLERSPSRWCSPGGGGRREGQRGRLQSRLQQ